MSIIKVTPGSPPKEYDKKNKKAIGLFVCKGEYCLEMKRAIISKKGDVYIPHIVGFPDHESFHISGEFHWTWENLKNKHIYPLCGATDAPVPFRFKLIMDNPPCFCLRGGGGLSMDEIEYGLRFSCRFLPFDLNLENIREITSELREKGFSRFVRKDVARPHSVTQEIKFVKWNDLKSFKEFLRGTPFEKDLLRLREDGKVEKF